MNRRGWLFGILGAAIVGTAAFASLVIGRSRGRFFGGMMGGGMMGSATSADMQTYMYMFAHHTEIARTVVDLPNGVRTVTESANPRITAQLQDHVSSMYAHVNDGQEVRCMSDSLPTMFQNPQRYERRLELTPKGVAVTEVSNDPELVRAIQSHAREITGFVKDGMPAMMRTML